MLHMLKITSTPNNPQCFLTLWSGSSCCAAQMNKPSEASRLCAVGTVERKCYHNNISDSTQQNTASLSYITVDKTKHHLSLQRRSLSLAEGSRRLSLFTPQIQRGVFFFFFWRLVVSQRYFTMTAAATINRPLAFHVVCF